MKPGSFFAVLNRAKEWQQEDKRGNEKNQVQKTWDEILKSCAFSMKGCRFGAGVLERAETM